MKKDIINFFKSKLAYNANAPFFCFIMTAIAAIFTLNTHKKSDNLKYTFRSNNLYICILFQRFVVGSWSNK